MINTILESKKVRSVQINTSQSLIETNRALIITDLMVSKGPGRITFRITDGTFESSILWIEEKGTFNYSFPDGLKYWKGGNLEVINNSEEPALITIGYMEFDGFDQQKWRNLNGN